MEHFIERAQIRSANWNSIEERTRGKYCRAKCKEENAYTTERRRRTKKKQLRKQRMVGSEDVFRFTLPPSVFQAAEKFVINGFSHSRGITRHVRATFFPICRHRSGPVPVQVCVCVWGGVCGSRQTANTPLSQQLTGRSD